jgi:hypothetical protein
MWISIRYNKIRPGSFYILAIFLLYPFSSLSLPDTEYLTKEDIDRIYPDYFDGFIGKRFIRSIAKKSLTILSGEKNFETDIRSAEPRDLVNKTFSASELFKQFKGSSCGIVGMIIAHSGKQSSKQEEKEQKRSSYTYEQLVVIRNKDGNFFLYPLSDKQTMEYWIGETEIVPAHKDNPKALKSARKNWGKNKALTSSALEQTFVKDVNTLNRLLNRKEFDRASDTYTNLFGNSPMHLMMESIDAEFFLPQFEFTIDKMKSLRNPQPFNPQLNPSEWPPLK